MWHCRLSLHQCSYLCTCFHRSKLYYIRNCKVCVYCMPLYAYTCNPSLRNDPNNPLLSCPLKILGRQEAFRDCWGWQCQSVLPIFWSRSWRVFPGGLSNHSYSALLLGTTGRWLAQSGCHPECVATAPCISLGRSMSRGFVWWPWDALSQYAICVALSGLTGLEITSWGFAWVSFLKWSSIAPCLD